MITETIELKKSWEQRVRDCLKVLNHKDSGYAYRAQTRRELLRIGRLLDKAIAITGFDAGERT